MNPRSRLKIGDYVDSNDADWTGIESFSGQLEIIERGKFCNYGIRLDSNGLILFVSRRDIKKNAQRTKARSK